MLKPFILMDIPAGLTDVNNTDFLEESFDGRSVSLWIKPESEFYTGPRVVAYENLVGYYPFDAQTDSKVDDLSANELKGNLLNGSYLQSGQFGQSVFLDGSNDQVGIPSNGKMAALNQDSYTISMWVMPNGNNSSNYTEGRLHAHGFLRGIDNIYYTNIETMLSLTPSGSNYLTNGPGNRGLDFNNNGDYRNAGIGINGIILISVCLMVYSTPLLLVPISGKFGAMMIAVQFG